MLIYLYFFLILLLVPTIKLATIYVPLHHQQALQLTTRKIWAKLREWKQLQVPIARQSAAEVTYQEIAGYVLLGLVFALVFIGFHYLSLSPRGKDRFFSAMLLPILSLTILTILSPFPTMFRARTQEKYYRATRFMLGAVLILGLIEYAVASWLAPYTTLHVDELREIVVLAGVCSWITFYSASLAAAIMFVLIYLGIAILYLLEFIVRGIANSSKGALTVIEALVAFVVAMAVFLLHSVTKA